MFEFSGKMETVETFKPRYDAQRQVHRARPRDRLLRSRRVRRSRCAPPIASSARRRPDDPNRRYTYIECLSNLRNTNGRPTQLTNADPRYIDYYGRPWAQNWEKYFESRLGQAEEICRRTSSTSGQLDKREGEQRIQDRDEADR